VSRLTDFGIAKARDSGGHTRPGLVKGKLRYMAPEQAAGRTIDRRVDVWAAGVVGWELFAHRRLFDEHDETLILLRLVQETPPRLTGVPPALADLLARALRPKPAERLASAEELRAGLVDALGEPPAAHEEVGAFVRSRLGVLLEERHGLVVAAREATLRQRAGGPAEAQGDESGVRAAARPRARGLRPAIAALLVTAIAGAAIAMAMRMPQRSAEVVPAQPTAPAPVLEPSAASDPHWELEVRADAPMVQIDIGARTIAVAPAASSLTVRLGEAPPDGLEVSARSLDGRRARSPLLRGEAAIVLAFPAAATTPSPPRRSPRPRAAASADPPPLPQSPYQPQ
jgi:serine/threonine-protein kinase